VLGLLKEQDMHGYELKKRLSELYGFSGTVSFGSLYPALARLEAAGAVRALAPAGGASPPSVAAVLAERRASRRRKVYSITARGAELFQQLLMTDRGADDDERLFNLRLAFARYLPPGARLGLFERRRALLGEKLAQLATRARARRDDRYARLLAERQQDTLARDVSWLERLITEERAAGGGQPVPALAGPLPDADADAWVLGAHGPGQGPGGGPGGALAAGAPGTSRLVPLVSTSQLHYAPSEGLGALPALPNHLHLKDGVQ